MPEVTYNSISPKGKIHTGAYELRHKMQVRIMFNISTFFEKWGQGETEMEPRFFPIGIPHKGPIEKHDHKPDDGDGAEQL